MIEEGAMKREYIDTALSHFDDGCACSQSILLAFSEVFNLDETVAKRIASTFGGGMGRLREKCGAVTGAFMVLGLAFGNVDPKDMKTKLYAYEKVRELNARVQGEFGTTLCAEFLRKKASAADIAARAHHRIVCRSIIEYTVGALVDILIENGRLSRDSAPPA